MASNILSKFLPQAAGEPSIYETLQQHDEDASDLADNQDLVSTALDEENLGGQFHDDELDIEGAASYEHSQGIASRVQRVSPYDHLSAI